MAEAKPAVGFIGTGVMGAAIAHKLLENGFPLTVWNRTPDKLEALRRAGAEVAGSPADLARASEVVFLCVTDTAAVEAVVFGEGGVASGATTGKVLVDHSSIRPRATRDMAVRLSETCAMGWVDAPVSGGVPGVETKTLVVMAGGTEADVETVRPVIESYAGRLTRMGASGAGQTTKLINQVLAGTGFVALAEACRLARNAGVDPALIPECLAGGRADSRLLQEYMPKMAAGDMSVLGRLDIMVKDLDTVHELAVETVTPMPLAKLAGELHRFLVAQGRGAEDNAAIVKLYGED